VKRASVVALTIASVLAVAASAHASSTPPIFGTPTLLETLAPFPQNSTGDNDISCGTPTTCVAVGGTRFERTTDAGSAAAPTWSAPQVIEPSNMESVSCPTASLCVAVADDGTVVRSTDGGATWSAPISVETGAQLKHIACTSDGTCLAAGTGILYVSGDGAQTWTGPDSIPNNDSFGSLTCPQDGVCVGSALGSNHVYVSTDVAGTTPPTWTLVRLTAGGPDFLTDISCTGNGICVAVDTFGYAYVTTDVTAGSPTWSPMLIDGTGSLVSGLVGLESVSCAETSAGASADVCVAGDFVGSTAISANIGSTTPTWSVVPTFDTGLLESADGSGLFPDACVTGGWCVVATNGGNEIYATIPLDDPAGTTWSDPPATIAGADHMAAVSCSSNGQVCAALDTTGHAVTSVDGGGRWSPASTVDRNDQDGGEAVSCVNSGQCVAVDTLLTTVNGDQTVSSSQVLRSTPTAGGATWSSAPVDDTGTSQGVPTGPSLDGISCADSGLCAAVDLAGGSIVSTDLGQTWTSVPTSDSALLSSVSCPSSDRCVAVDRSGGAIFSTDLASADPAWSGPVTADPSGVALTSVSCTPHGPCVAADAKGRVVTSYDGGGSWSAPLTINGPPAIGLVSVSCTAASLCVSVDKNGNAYYTTDPGDSTPAWEPASTNTSDLTAISCVGTGLCLGVDAVGDAVVGVSQVGLAAVSGVSGDFPDTLVGTDSLAQTLTVTNAGGAPLNVASVSVTGDDTGEFALSANACDHTALAPGAACTVTVAFAPAQTGSFSASLVVASDSASSPDTIALSGRAVLGPILSLSGDPVTFTATRLRTTSTVQTETVTNTGGWPLHLGAATLAGAAAPQFKLVSDACQGAVLAPGASCSIGLAFAPTSTGSHSANLELASDLPASPTVVPLTGVGITGSSPTTSVFSFVSVRGGRHGTLIVKLKLTRAGRLSVKTSTLAAHSARRRRRRRMTYGPNVAATVHGPTAATITIRPRRPAAAVLKTRGKLRVLVGASFAPTGLRARTKTAAVTVRER
jgi:hypothetical protein